MTIDKLWLELVPTIPGNETHQENSYIELLQPKFNKVFYETYDEVSPQFNKVFIVQKSKKNKEYDFYMGAMSNWSKFGTSNSSIYGSGNPTPDNMPSINYQMVPKGSEIVYTHDEFADGFMVERKFIDDEMYGVIEKMTKDLARAGRSKVETDCAAFIEGHLGGTLTGFDNQPLFGTHTALNGTYSYNNRLRTKLSPDALKQAISQMRRVKDEAGKTILFQPDTLIVPPELEFLAEEILKSRLLAGTDLNNVNSLSNRLKVQVWDYLTDPDCWFLTDSKRNELRFYWRVKPEFEKEKDFDTKVHKWSGYMRYSYGYSSTRGIIGSTGELPIDTELSVYDVGTKASAMLTFTGVGVDNETVTIGDKTYELTVDGTITPGNIAVDCSEISATMTADEVGAVLEAVINLNDDKVNAKYDKDKDILVVSAKITGVIANGIAVSETLTNGSWGTTYLVGGSNPMA